MTSDAQIRAFIDRILRLKEEQDTIGEDIRDIYAEAKSTGFDKTAMGNVVAHLRKVAKKGSDTVAEQGAIFDLYLCAYEGKSPHAPAPARVRENIEQFDPTTGEIIEADVSAKLVETIATGVQTEVGRAALIAAVDIMIEREEQEIATSAGGESEEVAKNAVASASGPDEKRATNSPEQAPEFLTKTEEEAEAKGAATVDTVSRANEESDRQRASGAGPADGRQHGGGDPMAAAGDHAPSFIAKPKYVLRPNCRNPEACGGYGENHCHPCQKAMREQAEEVA
ncbi:DUF2312 domain-containing protein [Sinorhizobium meliloti]|uniref:DUF2312 domain-containing protein n=1 Tax=Rhizobium meliloti TaxID=382 RepID=UPI000D1E6B02|nr:GapR family DNA-binding domain-containing protein [Sinorhizobium meliloti]MDE3809930.1 DUF2312 domain-containing protein [Sinorhizobium meliloti]RMI22649.1 DUF2312 domain-containing protein [Sinorhizobium meliloti]RVG91728.1 DUF2312 domain-containing protein [Sinorhizobium meliloti]RVK27392.1 DUF2312 domain-containing protein [Sinorhizobium meliloti]RVP85325.1 DUF2312 domain-containing protein [Sinorhizobium meliloti]